MSEILVEICQEIGGMWVLDRSDKFDEALKEMGKTFIYLVYEKSMYFI